MASTYSKTDLKRYDIHSHTHYSPCSNMDPRTSLRLMKKRGMQGMAVTDHHTIKGGVAVKKLNKDRDFEVIVGCEITTNFGDVLILDVSEEIREREFFSLVDRARRMGAIIIIPHPFRLSLNPLHTFQYPIEKIINRIDAIECLNARMLPGSNGKAQALARKFKITGTGGSDAHFWFEVARACTLFDGNLRSALKQKKTRYEGSIGFGPLGGTLSFLRKRMGFGWKP